MKIVSARHIEQVGTTSLIADALNPRCHSKKQIKQLVKSILAFGFNVPILIDGKNRVIAGHGRLQACKELNLAEVAVIRLEHLTEPQIRAFMIADNKLTENATWDEALTPMTYCLKGLI